MMERETDSAARDAEPAPVSHRAPSTGYEAAGCMGAACGAIVRIEEQAALDDYEAEMTDPDAAAATSKSRGAPDE